MRVFLVDSEDLPGSIYGSLIVLRDDKGARENEATDRERMPVLSLCRTWLQVLGFYFRVPFGSKLCLEFDLIHLISPSPSARARAVQPRVARGWQKMPLHNLVLSHCLFGVNLAKCLLIGVGSRRR
jgi:hypothetical protein